MGNLVAIVFFVFILYKFLDEFSLIIDNMPSGKFSAFFIFVVALLPFILIKQIFIDTPDEVKKKEWELYGFLVILAIIIGVIYVFIG